MSERHLWGQENFQSIPGVTKWLDVGTAQTVCARCGVVLGLFTSMKCLVPEKEDSE